MSGKETFRSTPEKTGADNLAAKQRLNEEYRSFLEKVVKRHPDLKGIGKER